MFSAGSFALIASAGAEPLPSGPLSYPRVVDLGTVYGGAEILANIPITNISGQPVDFDFRIECGCTRVLNDNARIPAGRTLEMKLFTTPVPFTEREVTRLVWPRCDSGGGRQEFDPIEIRYRVGSAFNVSPNPVILTWMPSARDGGTSTVSGTFTLANPVHLNHGDTTASLRSPASDQPVGTFRWVDDPSATTVTGSLRIDAGPLDPVVADGYQVVFESGYAGIDGFRIPVAWAGFPPVKVWPPVLRFYRSAGSEATATLSLESSIGPIRITSATARNLAVAVGRNDASETSSKIAVSIRGELLSSGKPSADTVQIHVVEPCDMTLGVPVEIF